MSDAKAQAAIADAARADRLAWPPTRGTRLAVYLPNSIEERLSEVVAYSGDVLDMTEPPGAATQQFATDQLLKLLFQGRTLSWGFDGLLDGREDLPRRVWRTRIVAGPVPVERRDGLRVPHRVIVVVRHGERMIPAHMLDRSTSGMRCAAGRGVDLEVDDRVMVEVDRDAGDVVHGARVVWRRPTANGVEFGLQNGA